MRFTAYIDLELPEEMYVHILATAGVKLQDGTSDAEIALLAAATRQLPTVLREYLLSPGHVPVRYGEPVCLSTADSPSQISVTIMEIKP